MQRTGRYYVPWFNAKYGRSGSLFQGRFKTSVIDAASYFMQCSQYIELAPVRAQLAGDALAYPWSSYAHHAGVRPDPVITDHALYWALGNTPFQREAAYKELAERALTAAQLQVIERRGAERLAAGLGRVQGGPGEEGAAAGAAGQARAAVQSQDGRNLTRQVLSN